VIRLLIIFSPEKDKQGVSYFFATLNMQEIPDEELQSLLFPERSEKAQNQG